MASEIRLAARALTRKRCVTVAFLPGGRAFAGAASPGAGEGVARLLLRPGRMTANPLPLTVPSGSVSASSLAGPATPARAYPPGTQLNWLVRYVPIKSYLTGPALTSLIEVGSGARGLATIIDDSFVGIDVRIDGEPAPSMYPFSYDGGRVPFQAGSFHTVVSMDTLEHVPPANRVDFLKELLRISAARIILGFPTDNGKAKGLPDDFMRNLLIKLGMGQPAWLTEHDEFGLPPAREVEAILDQLDDWAWRPLPTAGDFVNLLAALADIIPGTAPTLRPVLENNAAQVEAWVLAGAFGSANRKVYLIERRRPLAPRVDLTNPATLINAIICPNCDGETEILAPGVRCRGCGAGFAPDANGVFRMQRTAVAPPAAGPATTTSSSATPTTTTTGITFALTPDWTGREWLIAAHNFLHAFAASEPHKLWVTVDPRQLSVSDALELLSPLLLPFGEQPFAEIMLSETAPELGAALPLSSDRQRVHDYSSEWFRAQARAAAAPARAADPGGAKVYW
jgi:hypothetical protein